MPQQYDRTTGWGLLVLTFVLVAAGFGLFMVDSVGWAQFLWVLASGTAGGGIVMVLEKRN